MDEQDKNELEQPDSAGQAPVGTAKLKKKKTLRRVPKKAETLSAVALEKSRAMPVRPSLWKYTLLFLYKNLYILGITLLRRGLRLRRRAKTRVLRLQGAFYAAAERFTLWVGRTIRGVVQRVRDPFRRIHDVYEQQQPHIHERRAKGSGGVYQAYLPVFEAVGRFAWKILTSIFNLGAPIVAAVLLVVTITDYLGRPYALQLEYAGEKLGYVQNEAVFDEATQMVRERVIDQGTETMAIDSPAFKVEEVNIEDTALMDSAELADALIRLSGSDIEEAYGFYVNNRFYGAVTDKDTLLDEMDAIKETNEIGKPEETVQFVKSIRLTPALYPASSLVDAQQLVSLLHSNESESEVYTVQAGDTPSEIAEKNGMRYEELLRLNPTIEEDLKPGMELQTAVARPFLSVKNMFVETYEEEIPYETVEVENATYVRGHKEVTQEGVNGVRKVVAEVTMVNGQEIGRTVIDNSEIVTHPVDERIVIGIADVNAMFGGSGGSDSGTAETDYKPSGRTGQFIWPTVSGRATTYAGHSGNGIDIAPGGAGHPIYASASGVVSKVVNGYTGYGHYILIDHQNGYVTRYAHNSKNLVSVGQVVQQGEVIALMGRTGRATGNHLHFEIIYNGRYLFPADFVGWSG